MNSDRVLFNRMMDRRAAEKAQALRKSDSQGSLRKVDALSSAAASVVRASIKWVDYYFKKNPNTTWKSELEEWESEVQNDDPLPDNILAEVLNFYKSILGSQINSRITPEAMAVLKSKANMDAVKSGVPRKVDEDTRVYVNAARGSNKLLLMTTNGVGWVSSVEYNQTAIVNELKKLKAEPMDPEDTIESIVAKEASGATRKNWEERALLVDSGVLSKAFGPEAVKGTPVKQSKYSPKTYSDMEMALRAFAKTFARLKKFNIIEFDSNDEAVQGGMVFSLKDPDDPNDEITYEVAITAWPDEDYMDIVFSVSSLQMGSKSTQTKEKMSNSGSLKKIMEKMLIDLKVAKAK